MIDLLLPGGFNTLEYSLVKIELASARLQIILWLRNANIAKGDFQYFITFTDDFSRYGYIYLMRHKSESFEKFKEFQNEV
jgi:hypothetical protein